MSRPTPRILLVEDDHEDAFLFQRRCRERMAVHHVTTAGHAFSALAGAAFDACFVDYRLGTDSGLEFVRAARARHPGLPLILITGLQIEVLGENALLAGATDFIPKEHLDAPTIERTVRWALIRRHVELRRDDQALAATVSRLMGRVPAHATSFPGTAALRRLVYVSTARGSFSTADLLLMSSSFASANARMGITGVLAYSGERFLQAIEGPEAAMGVLLRRIEADPRHTRMHVLADEPATGRWFGEWHLGWLPASPGGRVAAECAGADDAGGRLRTVIGEAMSRSGIERALLALPQLG